MIDTFVVGMLGEPPLAADTGMVAEMGILWVYLSIEAENVIKFFLGIWRFRSKKWICDVTCTEV